MATVMSFTDWCHLNLLNPKHDYTKELYDDYVEKKNRMSINGMGSDQPIKTNEAGASQSDIPYRFDLIDSKAMFRLAHVLDYGAKKYGDSNWRDIPVTDHLNHMIAHAYAYLANDDSDDHLGHMFTRAMMAIAIHEGGTNDDKEELRAMVERYIR